MSDKTWWIVVTPTAMRELLGLLVDDQGNRVHVLMGPMEEPLVRDLAAHADPTVDVSVAHGWEQAPAEVKEAYDARRAEATAVRERDDAAELIELTQEQAERRRR